MNLFSLFSGIGAFEKALDKLEIPYELTGFSEIDKYAIKSYCAIHNVDESKNYGDITKIDENALPKNIDLITYGFLVRTSALPESKRDCSTMMAHKQGQGFSLKHCES